MTNDPVTAFRPTDEDLTREWPAARRTAVLERAAPAPAPAPAAERTRLRFAGTALTMLSAAAAVIVVAVTSQPNHSAARSATSRTAQPPNVSRPAEPLTLLAARAALRPAEPADGQYWHVVLHENQDGHVRSAETWTASDGTQWGRYTDNDGSVSFYRFAAGDGTFDQPTPAFLATLPTERDPLERYLRAHVSGSSSADEAVYDYLRTIVSSGYAPSALRSAAILVLADTEHVTVTSTNDSLGRPATVTTFVDDVQRPGETQTIFFDPQSSEVLEVGDDETASGTRPCPPPPSTKKLPSGYHPTPTTCTYTPSRFVGTYTDAGPVDSVPARVRHRAVTTR